MSDSNPFAALVGANATPTSNKTSLLEDIFEFTSNPEVAKAKNYVFLQALGDTFEEENLNTDTLHHALFDRLFMCTHPSNDSTFEERIMVYLSTCFRKISESPSLPSKLKIQINSVITINAARAYIQSEIYHLQDFNQQFRELIKNNLPHDHYFFKDMCKAILTEDDGGEACLQKKFRVFLEELRVAVIKMNLDTFDFDIFKIYNLIAAEWHLAPLLLELNNTNKIVHHGVHYAHTVLGALFNISPIPKEAHHRYDHFRDPTDISSNSYTETVLFNNINRLTERIHFLVGTLLRINPPMRLQTMQWLGSCVNANADRGKLWNSHSPMNRETQNFHMVSDGFMLNFSNVMLRLCQPFCSDIFDRKILRVDPTYCTVPTARQASRGVHMPCMEKETFLVPRKNDENLNWAKEYNFLTECFFITHKALDIGYRVTMEKLLYWNQEVGQLQQAYSDAMQAQPSRHNEPATESLRIHLTEHLTKYLSLKTMLIEANFLDVLFSFVSASCYWLCQVSINPKEGVNSAPLVPRTLKFPLSDTIPNSLKSIPECLIQNIVCYLVFLRRFRPNVLEHHRFEGMKPIVSCILIYMGSSARMRNPHLRARLAEALDSLLPHPQDENNAIVSNSTFQRKMIFTHHEHRDQIIRTIIEVFVSIEMTSENVQFEQKFNYRRPMYSVMDYVGDIPEYKQHFKLLAEFAEKNMEAVNPPLFLRFVNLLMNDSVYLLDEALTNMAKLKEMEHARYNGEWNTLPTAERAARRATMQQTGMIARFDNILGKDTINMLEKLTSQITIVFTHTTMVDRVASMLNYFLYNLVGPNNHNFKVRDQSEYRFNPAETVLCICKIYVNLRENESFCLAVSQDGRSYNPTLFGLAEDVLVRIGGGALVSELKDLARRVEVKASEHKAQEEAMSEAPEHFFDPIMSTFMVDPVILPSSRQTVNRTTIARHLLSDQTDPFNRVPLSMDQVKPNVELAAEIKKWLDEHKNK